MSYRTASYTFKSVSFEVTRFLRIYEVMLAKVKSRWVFRGEVGSLRAFLTFIKR